ncbi:lytic polysaccharide monooxygenase, partial [Pleomassaria siparia CBS 279.74]
DIHSLDYRCGRNRSVTGARSGVATVVAGSKVGFKPGSWTVKVSEGCNFGVTKSEEDRKTGTTNGEYFKVAQMGPYHATRWFNLWDRPSRFSEFNFTIPATTPPGFYLLIVEGIYPKLDLERTQLYASCAQVEIVGLGGVHTENRGRWGFPGARGFRFDEGVLIPMDIQHNKVDLAKYKVPGPKVWTG